VHSTTVLRVLQADDVALALQAIDGERHGRGGDPHVLGEVHDVGRVDLVEVIEDAGLVPAEESLALRIPDVAGYDRRSKCAGKGS
jgi:hypothetical protein